MFKSNVKLPEGIFTLREKTTEMSSKAFLHESLMPMFWECSCLRFRCDTLLGTPEDSVYSSFNQHKW